METLYKVECQRNNVAPREFYNYCKKKCANQDFDIRSFVEFTDWVKPKKPVDWVTCNHEEMATPVKEGYCCQPYNWKMYLEGKYNCIMEFEFDTETKGHGYFYAVETR